ncbi:hypothetical protein OOG41_08635 [Bacillus sp. AS_5]|uniref:hypothetical protein n=1 Tax=unclassified Bacillus (in: firmicutes) TaxID=185979 RepID=UPI0022499DC5|nr:hypothetical protein [Bacillus sp. AS_3]MCW4655802.1 hypothetical protein [Bacillus sp. AS_3]MCX2701175.1 hypothetical protein [Bacillus sp. AS_5]
MSENTSGYRKLYKNSKDVSNENVEIYAELDKKAGRVSLLKKTLIGLFLCVLFESAVNMFPFAHLKLPAFPNSWDVNTWILILVAFLIHHITSFYIHLTAYKKVKGKKGGFFKELSFINRLLLICFILEINFLKMIKELRIIKVILYFFFSPDYFYAVLYKIQLRDSVGISYKLKEFRDKNKRGVMEWDRIKIERKFFVEYSNWFNVCFIIVVTFLTMGIWNYHGFVIDILFYFLLYRLLSRSIEIIYAYYTDVVRVDSIIFRRYIGNRKETIYINNWKSSFIRKPTRISLACHTLFEMVLTFSLLYYFVGTSLCNPGDSIPVDNSSLYWEFLLYSASINLFNFSYTSYPLTLWSILHVAQVFIGVVLIVLSLARYLGLSDEITNRDEKLFVSIEEKRKG